MAEKPVKDVSLTNTNKEVKRAQIQSKDEDWWVAPVGTAVVITVIVLVGYASIHFGWAHFLFH